MTSSELRRVFWLGAASILILAALVAMAAIVSGDFGDTDAQILGTLFALLLAGATAISGLTLAERGVAAAFGSTAAALAGAGLLVVTAAIWSEGDAIGWEWAVRFIVLEIALLLVATQLLLLRAQSLRTLALATAGFAGLATFLTWVGLGEDGADGLWQLTAVAWILTGLGYLLLPVLQRFSAASDAPPVAARVLAELDGIELVATTSTHALDVRLGPGERLELRRRA